VSQKGTLFLLAGGNIRDPGSTVPSLSRALQSCGRQKPRVSYIGTASGDSVIFFRIMKSLLQRAGAGTVTLLRLASDSADAAKARRELEASDAVFLSGGEVEDGIRWLRRHRLFDFLTELHENGKPYIGISAGSIMMGSHWVRWEKPGDDSTASLFDCLAFVPTVFDTHAEDEDWAELKTALRLQSSGSRGVAIPRDGLLRVDHEGRMEPLVKPPLIFENRNGRVLRV
jgi:peptidase E